MADVLYLALIVGFFALMVLLVKACDHIIGPDETLTSTASTGPTTAAATAPSSSEVDL